MAFTEHFAVLTPYLVPTVAVLCLIVLILIISLISMSKKMKALNTKYNTFMEGTDGKHVDEVLEQWVKKLQMLETEKNQIKHDLTSLEDKQMQGMQKIDILRYNSFENMGGDLSFVITLLNDHNNGVVLNGLHSREGNYIYAKPIESGKSKYALSDEENKSLQSALSK